MARPVIQRPRRDCRRHRRLTRIARSSFRWLGKASAVVLSVLLAVNPLVPAVGAATTRSQGPDPARARARAVAGARSAYGNLRLHFEPNQGQTDPAVTFLARGRGYTLFLTEAEAVLVTRAPARRAVGAERTASRSVLTLRAKLAGARPHVEVRGLDRLPGKVNYLVGNDRAKWRTDVPTYGRVRYDNVYPGIDLVYYGNQHRLEYDFVVAPGADPRVIRLVFDGADGVRVDAAGDLVLKTAGGDVRMRRPRVYQIVDGAERAVDGGYVIDPAAGATRVGFRLAAYDRKTPLVIDPVLVYSSDLGGEAAESGRAIAVSADGSAYVTGETTSAHFPGAGGDQNTPPAPAGKIPVGLTPGASTDVFVAKLDPTGTVLLYGTYLGGGKDDIGYAVAVDGLGHAYVTGETHSTDFPVTDGAFDKTCGADGQCNAQVNAGGAAFVTELNAAGSGVLYSTYLGGDETTRGFAIAVDAQGNAYVTGSTEHNPPHPGNTFPVTSGAFSTTDPHLDGFMTKLSTNDANPLTNQCTIKGKKYNDCDDLLYSTYLNARDADDESVALAVDAAGFVYVAGWTLSGSFPTTGNAFQAQSAAPGKSKLFVMKLKADNANAPQPCNAPDNSIVFNDCADVLYSTYFGGTGKESQGPGKTAAIAVGASGAIYVAGWTTSADLPGKNMTTAPKIGPGGDKDIFVAKFDPSAQTGEASLVYSTYLGGSDADVAVGIAVDNSGHAYVAGRTFSTDFPGAGSTVAPQLGDVGYVVAEVSAAGDALLHSAYVGGLAGDVPIGGLGLDASCNAYVAGVTASPSPPLKTHLPVDFNNGVNVGQNGDAFVAKLGQMGFRAYIGNYGAGTLSVIETHGNVVDPPINLGASTPEGVAVTPDGTKVYVTDVTGSAVYALNTRTGNVSKVTGTFVVPVGVAVQPPGPNGPGGQWAYVANASVFPNKTTHTISVIDTSNDTVTGEIELVPVTEANAPFGIAANHDGTLYITNQVGGFVTVVPLDLKTSPPTPGKATTVKVGDSPQGIAVSPDGKLVHVANFDSGTVSVLDVQDPQNPKKLNFNDPNNPGGTDIKVGGSPFGITLDATGQTFYVTDGLTKDANGQGSVYVRGFTAPPPALPTLAKEVKVGGGPRGIALTPDGAFLYVANVDDDSVSVINTADNTPIVFTGAAADAHGNLKVGKAPGSLGQFVGVPILDSDGDGVWDLVDGTMNGAAFVSGANDPTKRKFTNQHLCGSVYGEVTSVPPGMQVFVASPAGIEIGAGGFSGQPATVSICGAYTATFQPANAIAITECGSMTAQVLAGPMDVALNGGGVLSVDTGVTFKIEETPGGGFLVQFMDRSVALGPGGSATLHADGSVTGGDTTPPTTVATPAPAVPNGAHGWYVGTVTVALAATDNPGGAGVKEIHFSTSGPQSVVAGSTASVPITADGTTTLTYFAVDNGGNQETPKTLTVRVDETAPTTSCRVSPRVLWPPDHRLVSVTASVTVADAVSGPDGFTLLSVTSNEPPGVHGAGHTSNDIQGFVPGTPSTTGRLRAERSGHGADRVYTLTYQGRDLAGSPATCAATVTVPHSEPHGELHERHDDHDRDGRRDEASDARRGGERESGKGGRR